MSIADPGEPAIEPAHPSTGGDIVGAPSPPERQSKEPRFREPIRGLLALALVLIFAGEVWAGLYFGLSGAPPYAERIQVLKDVAAIFLGPTIALVGAATGFYFGRSAS
jgi:hypothetical protein